MTINFEQDRVESVTQIDAAKTLSDKVLKNSGIPICLVLFYIIEKIS